MISIKKCLIPILFLALAGCAGVDTRAHSFAKNGDWERGLEEYRKALVDDPDNMELKAGFYRMEQEASAVYYQRYLKFMAAGDPDAALLEIEAAAKSVPNDEKIAQLLAEAQAEKAARDKTREGGLLAAAGKTDDARDAFNESLQLDSKNEAAGKGLAALDESEGVENDIKLKSKEPITLNFRGTDARAAFDFIGRSFGVNMIFDEGLKDTPVTIFAKDVTFSQGLNLLLRATQTFSRRIGPNTILLASDTPAKKAQYEDYIIRTFPISNLKAADMNTILKGVLTLKRVTINESLNALVIRDTPDILALVQKVIEAEDRRPPEVLFEVEILEVNKNKADQLGLDYGSQVSASFANQVVSSMIQSSFADVVGTGTITFPALSFNALKQDVDAKMLANPQVRVMDGSLAKIHIGDRVPLRSSTIQDTTGQIRYTYDYHDIGILVSVEPKVHLENSVTVKLGLEISSLGANIGTAIDPAYSIGTRTVDSVMLLQDGETAVLGGLIRDDETKTFNKIPGLGNIPVLGWLFTTSYDGSSARTDILFTITPHLIRGWELPKKEVREIYSGSEDSYSTKPLFDDLSRTAKGKLPVILMPSDAAGQGTHGGMGVSETVGVSPTAASSVPVSLTNSGNVPIPFFSFSSSSYDSGIGNMVEVLPQAAGLSGNAPLTLTLVYNPDVLAFQEALNGSQSQATVDVSDDPKVGRLTLHLSPSPYGWQPAFELARLHFQAKKAGPSYLIFQAPELKGPSGESVQCQVQASRVLIK
jgi:general secretion pathway protein D